jgi:ABC-type multidrug transport system fused ATPase/permease subunit
MATTKPYSNNGNLRIVGTLIRTALDPGLRLQWNLVCCIALELIAVALGVFGPYALKVLVDGLGREAISIYGAGFWIAVFIAAWLAGSILASLRRVFSQRIIDRVNQKLVDAALAAAIPDLSKGDVNDSGRVLGLVERLPYSLQIIAEGLVWQMAPTCLQVLLSLAIIMSVLKPAYVAILAVTLIAFTLTSWYGAVRQNAVSLDANAASGRLSATVGDVLRNARRVVLNGALPMERRLIRAQFADRERTFGRMLSSQVVMGLLQFGIAGAGLFGLLIFSAQDVIDGGMTVGDMVLLQAYAFRLVLPLSGFGFVISQAALAFVTVRELLDLRRVEEEPKRSPQPTSNGAALIVLDNVSFSYGLGLSGLQNVNLRLEPGSFNVVVGPNGSGKSTLAQVMAGVLEPKSGTVLIDGVRLEDVARAQRFRHVLYVPQTVTLLNRSLLTNALYPPSTQSEAELLELLSAWHFYSPDRPIDLSISAGEQGERLSGGQRQKLELARISRVRVPAIILDESTSALDPASEADIIQSLRNQFDGKTTLVLITHRKTLAEMADQVLFMKNGALMRAGRHEQLLQDSAAYARLWAKVRE